MSKQKTEKQTPPEFAEATPLYPNCLKEVDPKAYYFPHCDSPFAINPNVTYMPFQQIRFENEPITRFLPIYGILVLLSFCLEFAWLSLVIVPLCIRWMIKSPRLQTKLNFSMPIIVGGLLACVIVIKIIRDEFFWPIF